MTARIAGIELSVEGGPDLVSKVNPRLVSLQLTEKREDDADELDIVLQNADGSLEIPRTGVTLSLALGWRSGRGVNGVLVDKGKFTVDEVEEAGPPDQVTIRARSADMTGLLRKRRTKIWKDTKLRSILGEIAGRHGRTARVEAALGELHVESIEQEGKSDMAFIRDLGRRYDAIATWKGGYLLFMPIGISASVGGSPLPASTLTKRDGWKWSFRQADREAYVGAEAQWQDQAAARRRTVKVDAPKSDGADSGNDSEDSGKYRKLKRVYASKAEARQAATAAASRSARKPFTFTYKLAVADPELQPDMQMQLQGWGSKIDGLTWLIEKVTTTMGAQGLRQHVEFESA